MPIDPDELFPDDEDESRPTAVQAAIRFVNARPLKVFPTDMRPNSPRFKAPAVPGFAWKQRATSEMSEVVEDFMEAEALIGAEHVGVGWAVGQDGCVALDLDAAEPDWWGELPETAVNRTKRGKHLIFRQPPGRRVGNGVSQFPSKGWGEVRGVGGYIIIFGSDRPGFNVAELAKIADFPSPQWLTDSDAEAPSCSPAELVEFNTTHTTGNELWRIEGFVTKLAARAPGSSRNLWATTVAAWVAREIAADLVPSKKAWEALESWWAALGPEPDENGVKKTRKLGVSEIRRIERWAVGQLTPERVEETRRKADAEERAYRERQRAQEESMFGGGTSKATPPPAVNLPDEFWQARPFLRELRAYAHSRGYAADVAYAVVRARLNTLVYPPSRVDTGILTPVSLNSLVVLLGPSGIGKTTGADLGAELVPFDFVDAFETTVGSGEGIAEAYLDKLVPKGQKTRPMVMKAGLFYLDDGEELMRLRERSGSTLGATLRKVYSGQSPGHSNASAATTRAIPAHGYRAVVLANMQPTVAAELLGRKRLGDPQRFVFFATTDPTIPDNPAKAAPPVMPTWTWSGLMTVVPSIQAELRERRLGVVRGTRTIDPLDSHRDQNRVKEAAILARLDGRNDVNEEDWRLGGMVVDGSARLCSTVIAEHRAQADAEYVSQGRAQGVRAAAAESEHERRLIAVLAGAIAEKVRQTGGLGRGKLKNAVTSSKTRHRFDTALALAVANGWVKEVEGHVVPGKP